MTMMNVNNNVLQTPAYHFRSSDCNANSAVLGDLDVELQQGLTMCSLYQGVCSTISVFS